MRLMPAARSFVLLTEKPPLSAAIDSAPSSLRGSSSEGEAQVLVVEGAAELRGQLDRHALQALGVSGNRWRCSRGARPATTRLNSSRFGS